MDWRVISLHRIRDLDLAAPSAAGRPAFLSAASGLVCIHDFIYVVADDELDLGVFRAQTSEPGLLMPIFAGTLPLDAAERKKQKPDFEALVHLPAFGNHTHGALLALGSGSKRTRRMGALVALDSTGAVHGSPHIVDLSPILSPLNEQFVALNIEGAIIVGDEFLLLQRGNRNDAVNAIIRFSLNDIFGILRKGTHAALVPHSTTAIDLGDVGGVPLSFTDAAALPDGGMVFSAVAEDTDNSYDDGPCVGAAVGIIDSKGKLQSVQRLHYPYKIEGIAARVDSDAIHLLLVTDADDPETKASLFSATIRQ